MLFYLLMHGEEVLVLTKFSPIFTKKISEFFQIFSDVFRKISDVFGKSPTFLLSSPMFCFSSCLLFSYNLCSTVLHHAPPIGWRKRIRCAGVELLAFLRISKPETNVKCKDSILSSRAHTEILMFLLSQPSQISL